MTGRCRIALIGLGPAAQPHARALAELSDRIEVVAAVSRSQARIEDFARQHRFPVTTDIDAVIADRSIDAALILTPPSSHLELCERCFAAGKHVLVEKPLDITVARAERLVAAGRRAGLALGVVLQNRHRRAVLRLGAILAENRLGRVAFASMQAPWWRPQSYYDEPGRGDYARDGGGVLMTQAIHTLDIFRALVGVGVVEAAQVQTTSLHRMESEDHVNALVRLANGAPGSISATTAAYPGSPETIQITGERGSATLAGAGLEIRWLDGSAETVAAEGASGTGADIMDFPHGSHRALIADFVGAATDGRDPLVTGEDALATQRLIDEIVRVGRA